MITTPLLYLILLSGAAIAAAGLGAALGAGRRLTPALVGWAGASAAGLMLGVAYALVSASLASSPLASAGGAALAVLLLHAAHAGAGSDAGTIPAPSARAAVRASAIHSAAEGLAVGAAVALGPAFGVVLALTLVVHNVSEAAVLGAALRDEGRGPLTAATEAALARAGQVALAVATLALVVAVPATLPWALGAGFGGLLYLLFAELLPDSYQVVGRTGIAVVVSLAAGIVALLGGGARGVVP